jgi:hypothetical protein
VRRMVRLLRLIALISVLTSLLIWVRYTDRPSPAYPRGQFVDLLAFTLIVVAATAAVAGIIRNRKALQE